MADRPATKPTEEIEITPEMIEAAVDIVDYWNPEGEVTTENLVAEIYKVMILAKLGDRRG